MIDVKMLQQALRVLRDLNEKHFGDSSKKKPLLEDERETTLYLQFSLKKIPKCKLIQMIKINLPHSLLKDNREVCLIIGDLDKKNRKAEIQPDILHYKELLQKHGIDNISEIVTLRQLRTEYKPYEAKQKLLAAYDVFLADNRIMECLPRILGRHFFRKRKFPIQINIKSPNLKQHVENALSAKVFYLTGHGNCCTSEVAYLDMSDAAVSENIIAMSEALCDKLPGAWDNVMGVYLKTALSKAIPLYISYDDPSKVHLDEKEDEDNAEIDELSTCPNTLVKVYKDGRVETIYGKETAETESETSETENSDIIKNKKKRIGSILKNEVDNPKVNSKLKEKPMKMNKKSKNKEKFEDKILEWETDKSITCFINEEEQQNKICKKSKSKRTSERSMLISEAVEKLEDKSTVVDKKFKSKRKSNGNMLVNGPDKDALDTNREFAKISTKSESKRKREESIINETNQSKPYTPTPAVKKRKRNDNLKNHHASKGDVKGKKKKEVTCK